MYTQVEKSKINNKNRVVANSNTQRKSNVKQGFRFVDNWHKDLVQGSIQASMDNYSAQHPSRLKCIQRITEEEHKRLYDRERTHPLGLRYQQGANLPKEPIKGDQYGLQDDRYTPKLVDAAEYTRRLNETIELAVGYQRGWFLSNNGNMTLENTFDKVRSNGQLAIMASPIFGWRKDYQCNFGSIGKRDIHPEDFLLRIPLVNVWDYEKYKLRLKESWNESWKDEIWPYLVKNIKTRVGDAITLVLGGKLSDYNLGPSFDPDPKEFMEEMERLEAEIQSQIL